MSENMIAIMLAVYCVMGANGIGLNSTVANVTNFTGLLQFLNGSPCLGGSSFLGFAILAIIMAIAFGSMALRFDIAVAGAAAGWIGTLASLLIIQLGLLSSNIIGIPVSISLLLTIIALLRGGKDAY